MSSVKEDEGKEIPYLYFDGNSYVLTEIDVATSTKKILISSVDESDDVDTFRTIAGAKSSELVQILIEQTSRSSTSKPSYYVANWLLNTSKQVNKPYSKSSSFTLMYNKVIVNGSEISSTAGSSSDTPMFLTLGTRGNFDENGNLLPFDKKGWIGQINSVVITDNSDNILHDLVPYQQGNVQGMKDTETGEFYPIREIS